MRHVLAGLAVIVISAASVTLGAQHWPQFRGTMAGVAADHPNLPDDVEHHRKRGMDGRHPRNRLELTGCVGRPRVADDRGQHRAAGTTETRVSIWATGRHRRRRTAGWSTTSTSTTGRVRWEREVGSAPAGAGQAPEKQLRLGDTGHRRRACLLLFRQRRASSRSTSTANRSGRNRSGRSRRATTGAPARRPCSTATASTSSTTTTSSRSSRPTTRAPARRSGGSTATRAPTGRRRSCGRTSVRTEIVTSGSDVVRSYDLSGKLLWELSGMSTISDSHAVRAPRLALHQLGVHRRSAASGICHPPGRVRRHLAQGRRDDQRAYRLVARDRRPVQPDADRLRRHLLHALRPRLLHEPRREDGQGDLPRGSASPPTRAASHRRPGPTTAGSSR